MAGVAPSEEYFVPVVNCKRLDYLQWDEYFMATAILSAQRSKDPSTQVGAVIVNEDNRIVSIGYNGFPRHCHDDEFPWCKRDEPNSKDHLHDKYLYVVHAEANAILNKNSIDLKNTRLYTTLFPCNECTKLIIQSGITKIFYISDKYHDRPANKASRMMLKAANIKCIEFKTKRKEVVIKFNDVVLNNEQRNN